MRRVWAALLTMVGASWAGVGAQEVHYFGSAAYSTGSYIFDRRSGAFVVSNGARLTAGGLSLGLSIPILAYDGGLITTVGDGTLLPTGGSQHGRVAQREPGETLGTRKGRMDRTPTVDSALVFDEGFDMTVGDPYVSGAVELHSGFEGVRSFSMRGFVKVPVSDPESGAETGAWDLGLGASAIVAAGQTLLLTDLIYRWLGDMPGLPIENGVGYSVAASRPVFSGGGSVLLGVSGSSRAIEGVDPPVYLMTSVSRASGSRGLLSVTLTIGLTESVSDLSVGIGWSLRLRG